MKIQIYFLYSKYRPLKDYQYFAYNSIKNQKQKHNIINTIIEKLLYKSKNIKYKIQSKKQK